jgi:transcriptional regulator with XRE-family HTH domain
VSRSTEARVRVGAELRRLRAAAGVSGERVAEELGWSQAKVSRIEAARVAHAVADIGALLELYGAPMDLRVDLLARVAAESGETAWVVRWGDGPVAPPMEGVLDRIREYQPHLVPPLLQTPEYADLVTRRAGVADPAETVERRLRSQEALRKASAPRYDLVLDARVLLVDLGGLDILAAQVSALIVWGLGHVRLRVVPIGAPVGALSTVPFTIYDFRQWDAVPVVHVETPTADLFTAAVPDREKYLALFRRLSGSALSVQGSLRYLGAIRKTLEAGEWPCRIEVPA